MSTTDMFKDTFSSLAEGLDTYLSTKTVVSEPIVLGDTTIIPLVNVSFGAAAGAFRGKENINSAGGMGGKMTPSSVIVLKNNSARVINISTNTGLEKLIDMVPDILATIQGKVATKDISKETKEAAKEAVADAIKDSVEE